MPRKCASGQCGGPGVIHIRAGVFACEPCAEKLRLELAQAKALLEPVTITEQEQHAAQVANSVSLDSIFPELKNPAVLAQQLEFWKEVEAQ